MNDKRILLPLVGDIQKEAHARIKYGYFFDALSPYFKDVIPFDATLRGSNRLINALTVFHPDLRRWKERFWKNPAAFDMRSKMIANQIQKKLPNLVLQIGVTFDATLYHQNTPLYIYTDYTSTLSARRPDAGRSPFSPAEKAQWLKMEKEAYQRAKHIFVRSNLVKNSLVNDYHLSDKSITVCGGGVNLHPLPKFPPQSRNSSPIHILFIGKEFQRKGGDLLLQAFAQVIKKIPNVFLTVVTGERISEDLPTQNVKIIPATWDRSVVEKLFYNADIFVLPSRLETWGDVLLEAMSFGLPCIGVDGDAMGEIIINEKTGILVPPENIQSLANALSTLLQDAELRIRMGTAGRQRIETSFTWENVAKKIDAVINN